MLVVVPARGGSKGVNLKNIHRLGGIPLIAHVGRLVSELGFVDRAIVSTDHAEIAAIARQSGLDAPFTRPEQLSGDLVSDVEVLQHAITAIEKIDGVVYDVVVMLQPTSPLRRGEHVSAAVEKLVRGGWDAVWTVSPTDIKYHPLKALVVAPDGDMGYFDPRGRDIIARQQLSPVYHRNGAAYAFTRECIMEQGVMIGRRTSAVVVADRMISIDTLDDFVAVEAELSRALEHSPQL